MWLFLLRYICDYTTVVVKHFVILILLLYDAYHTKTEMNECLNVSIYFEVIITFVDQEFQWYLDFGNGSIFVYVSAFDIYWFVD